MGYFIAKSSFVAEVTFKEILWLATPIMIWYSKLFHCSHLDSGKGKLYVSGADGIMYTKSLDDHFVRQSTFTDYPI